MVSSLVSLAAATAATAAASAATAATSAAKKATAETETDASSPCIRSSSSDSCICTSLSATSVPAAAPPPSSEAEDDHADHHHPGTAVTAALVHRVPGSVASSRHTPTATISQPVSIPRRRSRGGGCGGGGCVSGGGRIVVAAAASRSQASLAQRRGVASYDSTGDWRGSLLPPEGRKPRLPARGGGEAKVLAVALVDWLRRNCLLPGGLWIPSPPRPAHISLLSPPVYEGRRWTASSPPGQKEEEEERKED